MSGPRINIDSTNPNDYNFNNHEFVIYGGKSKNRVSIIYSFYTNDIIPPLPRIEKFTYYEGDTGSSYQLNFSINFWMSSCRKIKIMNYDLIFGNVL